MYNNKNFNNVESLKIMHFSCLRTTYSSSYKWINKGQEKSYTTDALDRRAKVSGINTILSTESTLQQGHPYHLVDASPWPLQTSIVLGTFVASFVLTFAQTQGASILFWCSLLSLTLHMSLWFTDVVAEGSLNGDHTSVVMRGLVLGMSLFIMTEVIFFLFIFWTYLHSSLSPNVELGCDWPPLGIDPLNAKAIPTLNTALLLSSGKSIATNRNLINNPKIPATDRIVGSGLLII